MLLDVWKIKLKSTHCSPGRLLREPLSVVSELQRASAKMDGVDSTYFIIRAATQANNQSLVLQLFPDAESERRYNTCAHGLSQAFSHALGWSAQANLGLKLILNNAQSNTSVSVITIHIC